MANNFGNNSGNYSDDETRQIGRVTGYGSGFDNNDATRQFGAPDDRPRQVFPGASQPAASSYGQPSGYNSGYTPGPERDYDPVPSSYEVEPERSHKSGGSGLTGVFAAIAAIAVIATGALFFMWRNATSDAESQPEAVTTTATVTEEKPTTVTETVTEEAPSNPIEELPTQLPPDIQDQLEQGGQGLEGLLDELLNGATGNNGNGNSRGA